VLLPYFAAMAWKKWKAARLHTGLGWAPQDTVLVASEAGTIEALLPATEAGDPAEVQELPGVLCPGFVNAHCHLELSHLKGHIPNHTGMVDFLLQVMQLRRFRMEEKLAAMKAAMAEMRGNGIVAIADISNGTDSLSTKLDNPDIYFHNFIEITGFVPATLHERLEAGKQVAEQFKAHFPAEQVTLTPHAPYSVSKGLLQAIQQEAGNAPLSMHLMESEDELSFFRDKQGDFMRLYAQLGVRLDFFTPPGKNPLQHLWPLMQKHQPWLWVHNTEVSLHDLQWLHAQGVDWQRIHWCLCPGANQYINFATPALHRFRQQFPLQLCLGTDSLAGNYYLNPVYEMRMLQKHGRLNDLGYLLQMATHNGAAALGIGHRYGQLSPGKQPGILHLSGTEGEVIAPKAKVTVLA
jgi:cytosine/adenosine deaminase-related metal-dependent hydrolase